ncbi:MAG: hypothetical protein ACUVWP_04755 [bacterium]
MKEIPIICCLYSRVYTCYFTSQGNGWSCGDKGSNPQLSPILIHCNGKEWEKYIYGGLFDSE